MRPSVPGFFGIVILIVITSCGLSAQETASVVVKGHPAHPTRILAKVKPVAQTSARASVLSANGLRAVRGFDLVPGLVVLDEAVPARAMAAASAGPTRAVIQTMELQRRIEALRASGLFEYVEPDYLYQREVAPMDAAFADGTLWGLHNTGQGSGIAGVDIDAVQAWDVTTGSADVIVAVVDTGVRYTHADLAANMWRNPGEIAGNGVDDDGNGYIDDVHGINAIIGSGDPMDDDGHGTHVAGTIGAAANNNQAHVGVAWHVRLMALKFLNENGSGRTSDAIECIDYAVAQGARVINASWGGGGFSQSLQWALAMAQEEGVLCVAAAGNNGADNDQHPDYPSGFDLEGVIAVAGMDRSGRKAGSSNFGRRSVDLFAPGVDIFSTFHTSNTAYLTATGTSMAAPHVTGIAVLLLAFDPTVSLLDLRHRILRTVVPMPMVGFETATSGRANAYRALTTTPDGTLELTVLPAAGSVLYHGQATAVTARVTDLTGVTDAAVTGAINGVDVLTFRNDGEWPDIVAADADYTAELVVPGVGSTMILTVSASAPGKLAATEVLDFPLRAPPVNDHFVDRVPVDSAGGVVVGNNVGATLEAGESGIAGETGGASVWWTWTAPADLHVIARTAGSDFDTMLGIFTGTTVNGLTSIVGNDDVSPTNRTSAVQFTAMAGTTYQIAVDGWQGASGNIVLTLAGATPPPNDRFANRLFVDGETFAVSGDSLNGSIEAGEPAHHAGDLRDEGSVWWTWTAPRTGTALLISAGGIGHHVLVYRGSSLSTLQRVPGRRDDLQGGSATRTTFAAFAGETYQIALVGPSTNPTGDITMELSMTSGPGNDHFADRVEIVGASAAVTGSNLDATREIDEPGHVPNAGGASVWWTWTAPMTATAVFETHASSFDTQLAVYTGNALEALVPIVANDNHPQVGQGSRVVFAATAGMIYQVAVDGNLGAVGTIRLQLSMGDAPANDQFANRRTLVGESVTFFGTTTHATAEAGEPAHHPQASGASIWWTWTAPTDGTVTIDPLSGTMVTAVYEGASPSALVPVGNDAPIDRANHQLVFAARAGATYQLAVDAHQQQTGPVSLRLVLSPAPVNDRFENSVVIAVESAVLEGDLAEATSEAGEPVRSEYVRRASLWWTWTAPADGSFSLDAPANPRGVTFWVYTGTAVSGLTAVPPDAKSLDFFWNRSFFRATAGTTYRIALDAGQEAPGPIEALFSFHRPPVNDAFANRVVLTGTHLKVTATNLGASREATEPLHEGNFSAHSTVWWTWTAPASGVLRVDARESDFSRYVTIYEGSSIDSLIRVGGNSSSNDQDGRTRINVTVGTNYQIVVAGIDARWGEIVLELSLDQPPANDNFSARAVLSGRSAAVTATNIGAGNELDEPGPGSERWNRDSTVWWTWTAPESGLCVASTVGSSIDTEIAVFTGSDLRSLTRVASSRGEISSGPTNRAVFNAVAGTSYQIMVDGWNRAEGEIKLRVALVDPPANDNFANATFLVGSAATVDGSTLGATAETGEPTVGSGTLAKTSTWWRWIAPTTGTARVTISSHSFPSLVAIYTGDALHALQRVPTVPNGGHTFYAFAGSTYLLSVDSFDGVGADYRLTVSFASSSPPNDSFADRIVIDPATRVVQGSTINATPEAGEPFISAIAPTHTVWWTWTAPADGFVRIAALGANAPVLSVFSGDSITSLVSVKTSPNPSSDASFRTVAGNAYHFAANSYSTPGTAFTFEITARELAGNDSFGDRARITGESAQVSGSNLGATREAGEPAPGSSAGGHSVWWTWTAPSSGRVVIDVVGHEMVPILGVFIGSSVDSLAVVQNSDRFPEVAGGRRVMFSALEGVEYQIAVDGSFGFMGTCDLVLARVNPPLNDAFEDRFPLVGSVLSVTGTNLGASLENGEPPPLGLDGGSVWWSWEAPADGRAVVTVSSDGFTPVVSVYTGSSLSALTLVRTGSNDRDGAGGATSRAIFDATRGTSYHFAVDGLQRASGNFVLAARLVDPPANDHFADRAVINGVASVVDGSNLGSSVEPGEPEHAAVASAGSLWWIWSPGESGPVQISTEGSAIDTTLAVYTGVSLDTLKLVASNDDASVADSTSVVAFIAEENVAYQIVVSGRGSQLGDIRLAVSPLQPPAIRQAGVEGDAVAGSPFTLSTAFVATGTSFQWFFDGQMISNAGSADYEISSVQAFHAGVYTVQADGFFGSMSSVPFALTVNEPPPSGARLTNLSTRALTLAGDNVLIPGFVLAGPGNKQLLIRAVGPTLAEHPYNLAGTLPNPRLRLKRVNFSTTPPSYDDVTANDNWGTNVNLADIVTRSAQLGAFPLLPDSADAALLVDLAPGQYSVVADDPSAQTGIAIVELYDADPSAGSGQGGNTSRLINISNRGYVGTGDNIMIPGFVVSNEGPKTLLIRVVGPTLGQPPYNVPGVLADPTLSIFRHDFVNNTDDLILTNDDWSTGPGAQRTRDVAAQVSAFALPEGSKDAAFVVTLNPGVYTVHARGKNNTEGVALVEVYAVP